MALPVEKGTDLAFFVIAQNIHLRHLTTTQKVTLAKELLAEESKRAAARQKLSKGQSIKVAPRGATLKDSGKAAAKVAKAVGVSARSVEHAIAIDKTATKEIKAAVESGKMSLKEGVGVARMPKSATNQLRSPFH